MDVKKKVENKMFRKKRICNAIRTAYLYLFPDKRAEKGALGLNMELVACLSAIVGEKCPAYQTRGKP